MSSRIALGAIVVAAGVVWLLSATGILDLSYQTSIGLLLVLIGVAIALTPGRHGLLVLAGVLVALMGVPALAIDQDVFEGGVGDELAAPVTASDLEPYRHGIGKLTVDLTSPRLRSQDVPVEASLGIGELLVIVPFASKVTLDAHVGLGNVEALGQTENGIDVDLADSFPGIGRHELSLELDVGIGDIRVERR